MITALHETTARLLVKVAVMHAGGGTAALRIAAAAAVALVIINAMGVKV